MSDNRVKFTDRLKDNERNKVDTFFKQTIDEEEILKRRTYYLTEVLIKAIDLMSAKTDRDKSEIVRTFLEDSLPINYITEAREILKNKNK